MEGNVWSQLFALVADFASSLLGASNAIPPQRSGGASQNAPGSDAEETSTSKNAITLVVVRDQTLKTAEAFFGRMYWKGNFMCYTMERIEVAIPEGTYQAHKRDSKHFGMIVVGIDVPSRTNIEIHPANYPSQLEGCIAVGESIDSGALDSSRSAFDMMMATVPEEFTVTVSSNI
jgi:Family of unknown function (DUF5675)